MIQEIRIFDFSGKALGQLSISSDETLRMIAASPDSEELLLEIGIVHGTQPGSSGIRRGTTTEHSGQSAALPLIPKPTAILKFGSSRKMARRVPMCLVGRRDVLEGTGNPTIMTSYGGYGVSMTPQFSVFVSLPHGTRLPLCAAEHSGRIGVRGELARRCQTPQPSESLRRFSFRCRMAHRNGSYRSRKACHLRRLEFRLARRGRTDAATGFVLRGGLHGPHAGHASLPPLRQRPCSGRTSSEQRRTRTISQRSQSIRHIIGSGKARAYPATMIISGDADQNCNPLHARKMTARLQAANVPRTSHFSRLQQVSRTFPGTSFERAN